MCLLEDVSSFARVPSKPAIAVLEVGKAKPQRVWLVWAVGSLLSELQAPKA